MKKTNQIEKLEKTPMGRRILKALRYIYTWDEASTSKDSVISQMTDREIFDYYLAYNGMGHCSGLIMLVMETIYDVKMEKILNDSTVTK